MKYADLKEFEQLNRSRWSLFASQIIYRFAFRVADRHLPLATCAEGAPRLRPEFIAGDPDSSDRSHSSLPNHQHELFERVEIG